MLALLLYTTGTSYAWYSKSYPGYTHLPAAGNNTLLLILIQDVDIICGAIHEISTAVKLSCRVFLFPRKPVQHNDVMRYQVPGIHQVLVPGTRYQVYSKQCNRRQKLAGQTIRPQQCSSGDTT